MRNEYNYAIAGFITGVFIALPLIAAYRFPSTKECAQFGVPSFSVAAPGADKEKQDEEWDKQHDELALRDRTTISEHVAWAARVDIQLGMHERKIRWVTDHDERQQLTVDELVRRVHDLELVERSCRPKKQD